MTETALITGASNGIGLELARLFARDGYNLVLVARGLEKMQSLAGQLKEKNGVKIKIIAEDLSDPHASEEIFDKVQKMGIQVDVLVNNAGTSVFDEFAVSDMSKTLAMIQVNLVSSTHLTRLFLPGMLERKRGKILNVGSVGSFAPGPLEAVYCATKAYILSFSEALAAEVYGSGVSVTVLCPGATESDFARNAGIENTPLFQNTMPAEKVAEIGYKAMTKKRQVVVSGLGNQISAISYILTQVFMPFLSPAITRRVGYAILGKSV